MKFCEYGSWDRITLNLRIGPINLCYIALDGEACQGQTFMLTLTIRKLQRK